jgi:hypothetical protein
LNSSLESAFVDPNLTFEIGREKANRVPGNPSRGAAAPTDTGDGGEGDDRHP